VTYSTGESGKLFVTLSLPSQINVLTEPGVVHVLKIRLVRFVLYFIPLFYAIHFLMRRTFENKYAYISVVSDFPKYLTKSDSTY
jgi:hypothetical protein